MSLEGEFKNAIVTEVASWDFERDGKPVHLPYVGLFNGRENVQVPLDEGCTVPAGLEFGDRVTVWMSVSQGRRVVGEQSFGKLGLRALNIVLVQKAGSVLNGTRPLEAAA